MFSGCSSTYMSVDSYNVVTGQSTHKVYTKYYDAGAWLVPKHLGMVVVVDHEKTRIPILYGAQQSLGALGPSDCEAMGKFTIYIWNFDKIGFDVKILRITSGAETISLNNAFINAYPETKTGAEAGRLKIFDSATELPVRVEYELHGKRSKIDFVLPRRTEEELKLYFSPGGIPPYPWHSNTAKLSP